MQLVRTAGAVHPRQFGRGQRKVLALDEPAAPLFSNDLKLFATTFAAGFIFVSVLLA